MGAKQKLVLVRENDTPYNLTLTNTNDTIAFIKDTIQLQNEPEEVMICLTFTPKLNLIGYHEIARGGVDQCLVEPANIFKRVLLDNSTKFILAHNHPSGDNTPSKCDIAFTKKMLLACDIMGVRMIDHIIIADNSISILQEVLA